MKIINSTLPDLVIILFISTVKRGCVVFHKDARGKQLPPTFCLTFCIHIHVENNTPILYHKKYHNYQKYIYCRLKHPFYILKMTFISLFDSCHGNFNYFAEYLWLSYNAVLEFEEYCIIFLSTSWCYLILKVYASYQLYP